MCTGAMCKSSQLVYNYLLLCHLTFHVPPKFAPTLSMIPFSFKAVICLWVFSLDSDRVSAILDIEVVGFAEMMSSIFSPFQ